MKEREGERERETERDGERERERETERERERATEVMVIRSLKFRETRKKRLKNLKFPNLSHHHERKDHPRETLSPFKSIASWMPYLLQVKEEQFPGKESWRNLLQGKKKV